MFLFNIHLIFRPVGKGGAGGANAPPTWYQKVQKGPQKVPKGPKKGHKKVPKGPLFLLQHPPI